MKPTLEDVARVVLEHVLLTPSDAVHGLHRLYLTPEEASRFATAIATAWAHVIKDDG